MAELKTLTAAAGFSYDSAPQRTEPWYQRRLGKVSASRLEDWTSVSKAAKTAGQPLKKRLDYEKELIFERKFEVSYNNYFSEAMNDGVVLEKFAISQYEKKAGVTVFDVGCWYNDQFVASPDGGVGEDGLVEAKVLRDNSFSDLLTGTVAKDGEIIPALSEKGVHSKFWKQMQGQLWSSGRKWVDFIAINMNTKKVFVVRVEPDEEYHKLLELYVNDEFTVEESVFDTTNVFDFYDEAPEYSESSDGNDFNFG